MILYHIKSCMPYWYILIIMSQKSNEYLDTSYHVSVLCIFYYMTYHDPQSWGGVIWPPFQACGSRWPRIMIHATGIMGTIGTKDFSMTIHEVTWSFDVIPSGSISNVHHGNPNLTCILAFWILFHADAPCHLLFRSLMLSAQLLGAGATPLQPSIVKPNLMRNPNSIFHVGTNTS